MCYCEGERPDFYEDIFRVARKKHICCECGSIIYPGEKYRVFSGKWDHGFARYKMCMLCSDAWGVVWAEIDECVCFGSLWEVAIDFEDMIGGHHA